MPYAKKVAITVGQEGRAAMALTLFMIPVALIQQVDEIH